MAAGTGLTLGKITLPMKIGLGSGLVIAVGVLYYVIIHTDIAVKIDRAHKATSDFEASLANQRQSQATYFADRDELGMRQQRQRELNKMLPEAAEPAAFLSSLQQVSNLSGINLKAWTPREEVPAQYYAKVPMSLQIRGRFHQITKFIYEVGKLDRIINVENIELGTPTLEGEDVFVNATCLATTFHAIKKAPAAAPAKK